MRHSILRPFSRVAPLIVLSVFLSAKCFGQATKPAPTNSPTAAAKSAEKPKSQYNTNVFEKEDENIRFSDTVKLVRELDGNTEVLFMQRGGIYQAPADQTALARLVDSQRTKSSVNVIVHEASQKIMSVLPGRTQGTGQ